MIFFKHSINIDSSPDFPPFWFLSWKSPGKVGVQTCGNEVDVKICEISWRPQKGHFTHQGQKPTQAGSSQRGMLKREKSIKQHVSWTWGWDLGSQQDCTVHLRPLPRGWMDGRACFSLPSHFIRIPLPTGFLCSFIHPDPALSGFSQMVASALSLQDLSAWLPIAYSRNLPIYWFQKSQKRESDWSIFEQWSNPGLINCEWWFCLY